MSTAFWNCGPKAFRSVVSLSCNPSSVGLLLSVPTVGEEHLQTQFPHLESGIHEFGFPWRQEVPLGAGCYYSVWLVSGHATGWTWERKAFVSVMLEEASSSSLSDRASHQFRLSWYHLWPVNERLLQQKRRKWYSTPRVGYSFKTSAFRGLVIQLSWWRACSTYTRPWIQFPVPYKLGLVTQSHNSCIWEMKAWISEIQSHPQLHAKFKSILQHVSLCL